MRQTRCVELEHTIWAPQILEAVLSEVPQGRVRGQGILHERARRPGYEGLPAVSEHEHPCATDERLAHVVLGVPLLDLPRVERHARADRVHGSPVGSDQGALRRDGGLDGLSRSRECRIDGITDRLENDAVVLGDRAPQEIVVPNERLAHRRTVRFEQSSALLDVGEEERDRSSGETAHAPEC